MAGYLVENFAAGLDLRKAKFTAPAGTLRKLYDGHVSPGGEVEKREAFANLVTLPADTHGLASIGNTLYVFGTQADPLTGMGPPYDSPPGGGYVYDDLTVKYQQLNLGGPTIAKVTDWDVFDGKLFVIVEGSDSNLYHFYDGTLVPTASGRFCKTHRDKVYTVEGKNVFFCPTGDPAGDWSAGTGAGFINLATQDAESDDLIGLETYFGSLAILSSRSAQIWSMDPDPLQNQLVQVLRYTGTIAGLSVRQYGSGDLLYLDKSGVRSLRARDSSNTASVTDIGSPIDPHVREIVRGATVDVTAAQAAIDPLTGRFWMALSNEILVLSFYPGPDVTAWSIYRPNFPVHSLTDTYDTVCVRSNDDIYVFGGADRQTFDATQCEVELPFLDLNLPSTFKQFQGIDVAVEGSWSVEVGYDLTQPNFFETLASYQDPTYYKDRMGFDGYATHISLKLTSAATAEAATLANIAIQYQEGQTS